MPIAISERDGIGRCAVAATDAKCGDTMLVEKAALYWRQGPNELLDIIAAYNAADQDARLRVDQLTCKIAHPSPELDELIKSWRSILEDARSAGTLPPGDVEQDFLPILLRAHFNAHAVQSPDGACLFPEGAMLNHSCSPNTFYRCSAHTITFVASTNLQQGAELTAAYLDAMTMLKPTKYRQTVLLVSKGFLCACERCVSQQADSTRSVKCLAEGCSGVLRPRNSGSDGSDRTQTSLWTCETCSFVPAQEQSRNLESIEDNFYAAWDSLDAKMSRGSPIHVKEIDKVLTDVCAQLHSTHFIAQLLRVLLIEMGSEGGVPNIQLLAHSFIYASWLFEHFQQIPSNLLGTMTGALANLFDRKTHTIAAGLDIDRVLSIMKTVLPYARLRYGENAAYPQALSAVIERYSACSSLICKNKGKLLRCGRCNSAAYCSRSCQVFHYKSQGHKAACAAVLDARKKLEELGVQ